MFQLLLCVAQVSLRGAPRVAEVIVKGLWWDDRFKLAGRKMNGAGLLEVPTQGLRVLSKIVQSLYSHYSYCYRCEVS